MRSEDIIFANTVKIPSHISHAAKSGIDLMTFDSHEELVKIKKHCPNTRFVQENVTGDRDGSSDLNVVNHSVCTFKDRQMLIRLSLVWLQLIDGCFFPPKGK